MIAAGEAPVLLATKVSPPLRRGLIARPRLVERLRPSGQRLTVLDAPAGWGKSSLLAQWHETQRHENQGSEPNDPAADVRVAWLALDAGDNDPVLFWSYVVAALRTRLPGIGAHTEAVLRAGGRALRDAALPALVNELVGLQGPLVLVLDDYHVITEKLVHETLAGWLERLPSHVHVVVATRGAPPLGLGRWRAAGELVELRADDLAFRNDEVAQLLDAVPGLQLRADDVARLARRTEGWPAGVSLAAASLTARPGTAAAFVDDFTGTDRYVLDYLGGEVLARLPDDQREFVLRTSILRRLSPALCEAVTGRTDAAALLDGIERAGVFLVALDHDRRWFRYHRLFGELLRHELALAEPALVPELHRRAAAWSETAGAITEAVEHHVAAGDAQAAAALVIRHWNDWFNGGRLGTVTGWLDRLPESLVRSDARLCVARAWLLLDLGRLDEVDRWVGAGDAAVGDGRADGGGPGWVRTAQTDLASLRDLAVVRSVHRFKIGDLEAARAAASRVLELGGHEVCFAATVAHLMLGITAFWNGEQAAARRPLAQSVRLARRTGNALAEIYGLGYLGLLAADGGALDDAARTVPVAVDRAADPDVAEHFVAALPHLARAVLLAASGHPEQAAGAAERALALARRGAGRLELALALAVRAQTAAPDEARQQWLDQARRLARGCPDPGRLPARLARLRLPGSPGDADPPGSAGIGSLPLSAREGELLQLLAGTLSQREIGAVLHVSLNTVKTHSRTLFRKLGVSSRAEAVSRARELGLP